MMKILPSTQPHFELHANHMTLLASQDPLSGETQFPPAEWVRENHPPITLRIGPTGRLYTYTVVHPGKAVAPYGLAFVDFEPGVRVFGRLLLDGECRPDVDSEVQVVPFTLLDGSPDYAFSSAGDAR